MTKAPALLTFPSEADRLRAKTALGPIEPLLPLDDPWILEMTDDDGKPASVEIPAIVTALFLDALKHTAAGRAVSIVAADAEVTTQQAATILKVSRPLLVSLVAGGHLSARKVGNRLRLPLQDVLDYKAENGPKRRGAATEASPGK